MSRISVKVPAGLHVELAWNVQGAVSRDELAESQRAGDQKSTELADCSTENRGHCAKLYAQDPH